LAVVCASDIMLPVLVAVRIYSFFKCFFLFVCCFYFNKTVCASKWR
jgi:hypothetical protein